MVEYVIDINNLSMCFRMPYEKINSLKEYVVKLLCGEIKYKEYRALDNVSIRIKKGEIVGLLGANGSGKSTLLKCICGVYPPTHGVIKVEGTIAPLIELGAGFDPELTARENIYLNGAIMGYEEKFIREHYDNIVKFSELENFIDLPIKNYSSGMFARLGFSVATMVQPDILIVDEILGVGDAAFQRKCYQRMEELRASGITMLFVSHSIAQVRELCTRAIWLKHGEKVMDGSIDDVCSAYEKWISSHSAFE